jgi:hypothetical protein
MLKGHSGMKQKCFPLLAFLVDAPLMVHRPSRDRLALAIRRYVSGQITNYALDDVQVDPEDDGAVAVQEAIWFLYDDLYEHGATGKHYLDKLRRKHIARAILFLHSDLEYQWANSMFPNLLDRALSWLGFPERQLRKQRRLEELNGLWPFVSRCDFEDALAHPRYFAGRY